MSNVKEITVPDIGDATDVDVIEILVKVGDTIEQEDSIITLESDKASMEIPSSAAGRVTEIKINVGGKVSQGDVILLIETDQDTASNRDVEESTEATVEKAEEKKSPEALTKQPTQTEQSVKKADTAIHASPAVRRIAREFGVDLSQLSGTGRKARVLKEDVQNYVKARLAAPNGAGLTVKAAPLIDFSKFGTTEIKPLNKIKRLTGEYVHRSWITIPHVTHFDEADITELETFRKAQKNQAEKAGYKLTPLAFIVKAVEKALKAFPQFNSSLDERGENIILKQYYNIGIAVDTPNGLVVPVLRDIDKKEISVIAKDMAAISLKAREKGLSPADMSGGCFTISSLGGIGGTGFTPIVNAPDVAILGVSKAKIQPVYMNGNFEPRLILPFSLSYDHRVIDGAEAANFCKFLTAALSDIRTLLL